MIDRRISFGRIKKNSLQETKCGQTYRVSNCHTSDSRQMHTPRWSKRERRDLIQGNILCNLGVCSLTIFLFNSVEIRRQWAPLFLAAEQGKIDMVRTLLYHHVNFLSAFGFLCFCEALWWGATLELSIHENSGSIGYLWWDLDQMCRIYLIAWLKMSCAVNM